MFTYAKWHKFCSHVSKKSNLITAEELILDSKPTEWLVITHDVEVKPDRALKMAKIESSYGIRATYYFQADLIKKNMAIIKKIAELGHEVSYHYDVLDSNNGDLERAEEEFSFYVNLLRSNHFSVRSVCPHGNPVLERSGWSSNKDFFRSPEISQRYNDIVDIVVQTDKISPEGYTYISDAGYTWNIVSNVYSNDIVEIPNTKLDSIDDVLSIVDLEQRVVVSTHPHRWGSTALGNRISRVPFHAIKFILKPMLRFRIVRVLLSPFYSFAKRF